MAFKRVLKTKNGFITSYKKATKVLVEKPVTNKISVDDLPETQELYTPTSDPTVWQDYAVFINNGDGSITVDAKSMNLTQGVFFTINTTSGHKYLLRGCPQGGIQNISYWIMARVDGQKYSQYFYETGEGLLFDGADSVEIAICVSQDTDGAIVFTPELYDLTELFGAGYEPLTVEEAEAGLEAGEFERFIISRNKAIRVDTIQKWIPSKTTAGGGYGLTNTVDRKNGTITISGVTTAKNQTTIGSQNYVKGHKYLARSGLKGFGTISNRDEPHFFLNYAYSGQETNGAIIFTSNHDGTMYNLFYFSAGVDFSTPLIIRPQLYDLTEIFGAGNEPQTVEEAEALLGKDYIPYQYI